MLKEDRTGELEKRRPGKPGQAAESSITRLPEAPAMIIAALSDARPAFF
jgi:hypothetical protein